MSVPQVSHSLFLDTLLDRIHTRTAKAAVLGLGYVGLPLAVELGKAGFSVVGLDVDQRKVRQLLEGSSYVLDVPESEVSQLVRDRKLLPTADFSILKEVDTISICVPTPLRKTKDPDVSYIVSAVTEVKKYVHPGQLIVLESTTYPGTTEELIVRELEALGLKVGTNVFVAFSPERVDPGNTVYTTRNTPKVVGGVTPGCTEVAAQLYRAVADTVVPVQSARGAETVKLLENTFRSVNIALVNEFAMMCDRMGIDVWEVIEAAATKPFGFMRFTPGPGIGGHCIPLDPMYLSWKARTYDFYNRFIDMASDINGNMPRYVVDRLAELLNRIDRPVKNSRILILGVAYKKDVDDVRESPALEIIRLLEDRGAIIAFADPHVHQIELDGQVRTASTLTPATVVGFDAVLLVTDHAAFDYEMIAKNAKVVLDTRNGFKHSRRPNVYRLGTGELLTTRDQASN